MNLTYLPAKAHKLKKVFLMMTQNTYFAWKKCIHSKRNNSILVFL